MTHVLKLHPLAIAVKAATVIALSVAAQSASAQVVVDGRTNTSVTTDASGRVRVDIAAPVSTNRVSHNSFTHFNVDRPGLDINNRDALARLIVAEVTSTNPSLIQGEINILGPRANFILANPNGITVNGGRFVNTGSVALATAAVKFVDYDFAPGVPRRDVQLTTSGGHIEIGPGGLSGAFNSLDLISKTLRVNGPVVNTTAQPFSGIRAVTGSSTAYFDATVSPIDDRTPWVAYNTPEKQDTAKGVTVDITATGSLSAGKIELLVTDKGAGVRHAGMATTTVGDFFIQTDGQLNIDGGRIRSAGSTLLVANQIDLKGAPTQEGPQIQSDGDVQFISGNVKLQGVSIQAGTDKRVGSVFFGRQDKDAESDLVLSNLGSTMNDIRATGAIGLFAKGKDILITGTKLKSHFSMQLAAERILVQSAFDAANKRWLASELDSEASLLDIEAQQSFTARGAVLQGGAAVKLRAKQIDIRELTADGETKKAEVRSNGGSVQLASRGAINLVGTDILARKDVMLLSGGDVFIEASNSDKEPEKAASRVIAVEGGLLIRSEGDITNRGGYLQGKTGITDNAALAEKDQPSILTSSAVTIRSKKNFINQTLSKDKLAIVFGESGDVDILTGGDIRNLTGRIIANDKLILVAAGDVVNETSLIAGPGLVTDQTTSSSRWPFSRTVSTQSYDFGQLQHAGQLAYLVGNKSTYVEGRNIRNIGGEINASEGWVFLRAQNDVVTQAVRFGTANVQRICIIFCRGTASSDVTVAGGGINANGGISIRAGNQINNIGGRMFAVEDIELKAREVKAASMERMIAMGLYRGLASKFGSNPATMFAADQGGSITTAKGAVVVDGNFISESGEVKAAKDFTVSGQRTETSNRKRVDPASLGWLFGW